MKIYNPNIMRELKNKLPQQTNNGISIDPEITERYAGKVMFQGKIDRITVLLKDAKLNFTQPK